MIASISSVLADVADLAPAADKLLFRRGLKGHYVKDPGEHHAIVPLRKVPQRSNVAPDLFRLWELVAKAFIAAHMPDGIDARTTVSVQVATTLGLKRFAVSGSVVRVPGWRAVYGSEIEAETDTVPGKAKLEDEVTINRLPGQGRRGCQGDRCRDRNGCDRTAPTHYPWRTARSDGPLDRSG